MFSCTLEVNLFRFPLFIQCLLEERAVSCTIFWKKINVVNISRGCVVIWRYVASYKANEKSTLNIHVFLCEFYMSEWKVIRRKRNCVSLIEQQKVLVFGDNTVCQSIGEKWLLLRCLIHWFGWSASRPAYETLKKLEFFLSKLLMSSWA